MDNPSSAPPPPDQSGPVPSPQVTDIIDITIKTIDANNYHFQVEHDISIRAFKERIAPTVNIEPEIQRMIYCGRVLNDDKTLIDYAIDSGKVIHLVKRVTPNRTEPSNNTNQTSNEQQTRPPLFHSADDSIFTFSLEPTPNLINQIMRQIFNTSNFNINNNNNNNTGSGNTPTTTTATNNNTGATNPPSDNSGGVPSNEVHSRFNQIRRLLGYIETCFHILENPANILPPTQRISNQAPTVPQYVTLFQQVFTYSDRLRTHMDAHFRALDTAIRENNPSATFNNQTILMRISHHLSHVLHLFTDFNVDLANNTLTLNVLNNNPSSSSTSASGTANNRTWSYPRVIQSQNPIVLMEVDATINGTRNLFTSRPNLSELNVSINNISSNFFPQRNPNVPMNTANPAASNNGENQPPPTSGPTTESPSQPSAPPAATTASAETTTTTTPTTTPPTSGAQTTATTSSSTTAENTCPISIISQCFDPFLSCNSTYTIPELRAPPESFEMFNRTINMPNLASMSNSANPLNQMFTAQLNNFFQQAGQAAAAAAQRSAGSTDGDAGSGRSGIDLDGFDIEGLELPQVFHNLFRMLTGIQMGGAGGNNAGSGENSANFLPNDLFSRLGDVLNQSSAFGDSTVISRLINVVLQNLNMEDVYNAICSNFNWFNRFRQPLQDFIRESVLTNQEITMENIRADVSRMVDENRNLILIISRNMTPNSSSIDMNESFINFIVGTFSNLLFQIMQPTADDNLVNSAKYLITYFIHFCSAVFDDRTAAIRQLFANFFDQYGEYLNEPIRNYMVEAIMGRMNSLISYTENDANITSEVRSFIVYKPETVASAPPAESQQPPEEMQLDQDGHSISNEDSEVEFSDAFCDIPSTSGATTRPIDVTTSASGDQDWQTVVPNDWVPIISEDIKKQKNIDTSHQPPFSDAYISGMPKKRRLEQQQQQQQQQKPPSSNGDLEPDN